MYEQMFHIATCFYDTMALLVFLFRVGFMCRFFLSELRSLYRLVRDIGLAVESCFQRL